MSNEILIDENEKIQQSKSMSNLQIRKSLDTVCNNPLLDAGSPKGSICWTQFQYLVATGDYLAVEKFLSENVESRNEIIQSIGETRHGYNAFHIAARFGHVEMTQLLIANGVNVTATDSHGFTALHYAIANGHLHVVQEIIKHASPSLMSTTSNLGISAQDFADYTGQNEIKDCLSQHNLLASNSNLLRNWLNKIGMSEYFEKFIRAGYDDLQFINENGLEQEDLDAIGIEKVGHRKKLSNLYNIEEALSSDTSHQQPDSSTSEEEDNSDAESENISQSNESSSDDDA